VIHKILTTNTNVAALVAKCSPVPMHKACYQAIAAALLDTANAFRKDCAGQAAYQIGILHTAFVIPYGRDFKCIFNAEILDKSEKTTVSVEGCLSMPGRVPVKVRRHKWIKLRYFDPILEVEKVEQFVGADAIACQHEIDHGNGILI